MLRNDRHGHGVESHAHSYADTYADSNSHADSNTNSDANTYSRAGYAWKHFDSTTSRYR